MENSKIQAGSRYPEIMELNNLENEVIYPGQILKLPNWKIKEG